MWKGSPETWFFHWICTLSMPVVRVGFLILAHSFSLCPIFSLGWRERSVHKKRKETLGHRRCFGVLLLGDSGKGGWCIEGTEKENPLAFTPVVLRSFSLSTGCVLWLLQDTILALQLGSLQPTVTTVGYFHPQRCKSFLQNTEYKTLKIH